MFSSHKSKKKFKKKQRKKTKTILKRATSMRQNMTAHEGFVEYILDDLSNKCSFTYEAQKPIFDKIHNQWYILDFYIGEFKIVIEVDGKSHNKKSQKVWDEKRTKFLKNQGIQVYRINNKETMNFGLRPKLIEILKHKTNYDHLLPKVKQRPKHIPGKGLYPITKDINMQQLTQEYLNSGGKITRC